MADSAIAAEIHQALDVHRGFAPEVALDNEIAECRSQIRDLGFRQIPDLCIGCNACRSTDLHCSRVANAKDRRQPNHDVLV